MFLTGDGLKQFVLDNQVISRPPDAPAHHLEDLFDNICYRLTVGDEVYISSVQGPLPLEKRESVAIQPGEYSIIMTAEKLKLPPTKMGLVSMRFHYTGYGLINVSGFHVDPGFRGNFLFAIYNAGPTPVTVRRLEPMFMFFLVEMSDPIPDTKLYQGRYQGQEHIPSDMITALSGPSVSPQSLAVRVSTLETYRNVILGLVGGLLAAVTGAIIALAHK
jgi:dCTP deaminase